MTLLGKLTENFLTPARAERLHNTPFLEATMAAAALVACTGSVISFAKRNALDKILGNIDALKLFDVDQANTLFHAFSDRIRNEPEQGKIGALKAVSAIRDDWEAAQLLIQACCAICRADGDIADPEASQIKDIAAVLDLPVPDLTEAVFINLEARDPRPIVITIGNEKGGTGKSTVAVHLAVALLKLGYRVGSIDLDARQGTLSRYLANRGGLTEAIGRTLALPLHRRVERSEASNRSVAQKEEKARLREAFAAMADRQVVVIDTPGGDSYLSRLGHANADMLITPLNDSFFDIDVLAHIDRDKRQVLAPSAYCEMVWEQNKLRVASGRRPIEWIVMRNRLSHIHDHNKGEIAGLLEQLAKRIGFRLAPGFGERVVFRELFLTGLTLLDLPDESANSRHAMSHHRARSEVRELLRVIGVPEAEAD